MEPSDPTPSAPKRLQLKSRGEQKPATENSPSEAEKKDPTPPRRTGSLRLNTKPPTPQPEPAVDKTPPPPISPTLEFTNAPNNSAETAEKIAESKAPDPASAPAETPKPSAKKTSPVYYALLAVALIGSAYVLLKDKFMTAPPVIASEAAAPTIPITHVEETTNPATAEPSVKPGQIQNPASSNAALAAYLSELRASHPIRSTSPEGIVIGGIFFPPGALLLQEHGLTFNGFKDTGSPDVALLSTEGEQFELQLH